ncbi:MAG TPA: PKD domain-containing protein [Thermoplasmata archaeon]|nr:PKD domain-containing protein [Thermoplasmata archaeon]
MADPREGRGLVPRAHRGPWGRSRVGVAGRRPTMVIGVLLVLLTVPAGIVALAHAPIASPPGSAEGKGTVTPGGLGGSLPPAQLLSPPTGPATTPLNAISWHGPQVVSTSVTYRNTSIALSGGDLLVASGGSLLLDNVSLAISQVNGSSVLPLSYGVIVETGGQLTAKYALLESANGTADPMFVVASGSARFLHVEFNDLGGSGTAPVAGREGIVVHSAHVDFEADRFNHTYQVLFAGPGAVGDRVDGSVWLDSTIPGGQIGWVQVSGGASWTNLTRDSWFGSADAGMLALVEGPHVTLANSSLQGDPNGSQWYQVFLAYDGPKDRGVDASWARVVDNRFQTANLGLSDGAHFVIDRNWFNDTGHWASTGGQAAILVVTWIGSGIGESTRSLEIEENTITNFTHYAIRVSQNVSGFNISSNRIYNTRSTYTSAISEADGIYLIRGVNNGSVWNNRLDMTDTTQSSEPTNGIVLEAQVNDVNVSENWIFNCSEVGITVQGDSGALWAPSYFLGPSSRNTLYGNWVENFHSVATQTMYSTEGIETWMWANGTRVVDNDVQGWSNVSLGNYWNGAGILTSSSRQLFEGNRVSDARFGFVFEKFDDQQELRTLGSFNRSYNLLTNNLLSRVGVDSLVENALDDMGPVVNLLSGTVDPGWKLSFSGANATLWIENGTIGTFGASSPYRVPNVEFVGPLTLKGPGAPFILPLTHWRTVPPTIAFDSVLASVPASAIGWNVSLGSADPITGAVAWSVTQPASASDTFEFGGLAFGHRYGFSVDGGPLQNATANLPRLAFSWTGAGTHAFALTALGSAPPVQLTAAIQATPSNGTTPLSVQFNATVLGGLVPYLYQWRFGDGSTSTLPSPSHTYRSAGGFQVLLLATDNRSSTTQACLNITVYPPPASNLSVTLTSSGTVGEVAWPVGFAATAKGGAVPLSFRWDFGDGSVAAGGGNVSHPYAVAGSFVATVDVADARGHNVSARVPIGIGPRLSVIVTLNPSTVRIGHSTTVRGAVSGGVGPFRLTWSGIGTAAGGAASFSYRPPTLGRLPILLVVRDVLGASANATALLTVVNPNAAAPVHLGFPAPSAGLGAGLTSWSLPGLLVGLLLIGAFAGALVRRRFPRRSDPRPVPPGGSVGSLPPRSPPSARVQAARGPPAHPTIRT